MDHFEEITDDQIERQLDLEREMRTSGIQRYRTRVQRSLEREQGSNLMPARRLISHTHEKMVEAINAFVTESKSGKAGRRSAAVSFITKLDVDVVANITARMFLDKALDEVSMTSLAVDIGNALENEVNSTTFETEMPKAHAKFHSRANEESIDRRRWSHLLVPARLLGVELEEWEKKDRLLVGMKLIELFVEASGLFSVGLVRGDRTGTIYMVRPTPDTLAWMEEEHARLEALMPILMPTIIPPRPWTSPTEGGYYITKGRRMSLVKTGNAGYLEELRNRPMTTVYNAINALQNTAWAVNTRVLDTMKEVYEAGTMAGEIPSADPLPIPERPSWLPVDTKMSRDDMTEEQAREFKAWKTEAHRVYKLNAKAISSRAAHLRTISMAERFRDEPTIYFPHQLDWRGRAYPMPLYLQPQGSDVQRGLLTFADALPIADQVDADWLAIHGAGTFGVDKVTLEERVEWVRVNTPAILRCAADPLSERWWQEADKPWQFLAFCFEWEGFTREGFGYLSSIPCQMDGTCNGLQNFSAMLRDEIGGEAVNLVPAPVPQDIYKRVADIVAKWVERDALGDDEEKALYARGWLGNVNRSVCKRPVMTLAYGAKKFGFVTQIEEDTLRPWREKDAATYPFILHADDGQPFDYGFKAAMYLGGLVWEAVGEVVVAARAAMDWLQQVASIVSKDNLPINWVTPAGLLVQQAYRVSDMKDVETTFNKTRIRIKLDKSNGVGKIDKRRQASGISPNWVHSLDASHLMRTIERANAAGVTSFSMIHDSYGTHAANTGALAAFLREEFVRMYAEVDVLSVFRDALLQQTAAELPSVPPMGNLDLTQVLESEFFFA